MTKIELRKLLEKGMPLDTVMTLRYGQECDIYKADSFSARADIIYIPDVDLNNLLVHQDLSKDTQGICDILDCCYTGYDFMTLCKGRQDYAEELFDYVDWQHPCSALPEMEFEFD